MGSSGLQPNSVTLFPRNQNRTTVVPRVYPLLMESKARSSSLFYGASYRKTASHFSGRTLGAVTLWTADCVTGVPMDRSETAPHSTSHSKLYANLGVPPGASTEAIRRAYSVLEDTYRPGGAYVDDVMHLAFTEISRAASILGDPKTRKLYDQGYIDDFGKPTKAGLARTLRVRTAVLSCGALFAIGLAGLAIFTVESQNRRSGPVESATDANSVQHSSQLSPPPAADQTLKSVSNDKPASHGSDGAAPLQAGARDHPPPETKDGPENPAGPVAPERPRAPKAPSLFAAPKNRAIQDAQAKPREQRTRNPELRRDARLSRTGPGMVQSYIWFGAPAPASRPIRAAQTLKTAHCLACLTDHRADCSRACQ